MTSGARYSAVPQKLFVVSLGSTFGVDELVVVIHSGKALMGPSGFGNCLDKPKSVRMM